MMRTILAVMLGFPAALTSSATVLPSASAAPRTGAQSQPVRRVVPAALNQAIPKEKKVAPRIQITFSPDGKLVAVKIIGQDVDVTLHGVLRAQPEKSAVAARAGAAVAPSKDAGKP
jgi:hypothetical protein